MSPPIKRTSQGDAAFFAALENAHAVGAACRAAGYAIASVYRWRSEDPAFAAHWREAIEMAGDLLEEEADRRGRDGIDQPVFYRGKEVGQKRRYSDPLLLARLKAMRPEQYRDRPMLAAPTQPQNVHVIMRDFALEHALIGLLQSRKITLADIDAGLRPRLEKLIADKRLAARDSM
jgi:hypothetical protein